MNLVPVPVELPKEVWDLLKRVAGPAAGEIGLGLRDSLRILRADLQMRFFQRWQRKLAVFLHCMWRTGQNYQPFPEQTTAAVGAN